METKECKRCKNRFKLDALVNGLCSVCAGLPPQPEEDKTKRIVSSETIREADVVRIVKETVPTRDQVEVMIRMIVKEELANIENNLYIIGPKGPTSVVATADLKKIRKTPTFKSKNCIKCGNPFTPRIGFQKICDNCRKGDK